MAVNYVCKWAVAAIFIILVTVDNLKADVVVHKDGYASYTQTVAASKVNHFQVQFRTKDHTGLLLHAKGGSDFLTLELIRGRLRYAADFGLKYDSYGKVTSGFHELYVGQRLADNEWHNIVLIHNEEKHKVTIKVDNLKEVEFNTMRTIPQRNVELSIEYVHTGGMKFIDQVSSKESAAQRGIDGCFRNTSYNGKSVLDGAHVTLINAKNEACPLQSFFNLVDFPRKGSYVSYNYTGSKMTASFAFKTKQPNQVLFETEEASLPLIAIKIDKDGRVFTSSKGANLSSEVSRTHDGYWHNVAFSWSSNPPYKMILTVDGKASSMDMKSGFPSIDFVAKFFFGREFQGCMTNIVVSEKKLVSLDFDLYGPSAKWKPTFGKCAQTEFCIPNPCLHGGKCKEIFASKDFARGSFECNCTKTGYSGNVCSKPSHKRSCSAIKAASKNAVSGKAFLDVDGIGPLPKVEVECHFNFGSTETVVRSKLSSGVDVENTFGKRRVNIQYYADHRSMISITTESQTCQQYVKYVCTKSALFMSPKGPPQVRWLGPDEYLHYYWGGSNGKTDHCSCGVYNNCTDKSRYCNCDARSEIETQDEGALTNKKHLPMRAIEFLDVKSGQGSKGRFSIGALKCKGDVSKDNAVSFRDSMAYLEVKPTSVTDYNNAIDAMTVSFNFKTTKPEGVIFHGTGRISRDYVMIKIQSKKVVRAEINLGSKADFADVTIKGELDDNNVHSVFFEFNRKEVILTIDGETASAQRDPSSMSHLDLDGEPMSLGGGEGIKQGFTGCVSTLFINGLMIDIQSTAKYMEMNGVHAGCGIGCNRPGILPCNYGKCIENYSVFSCDCSLSPFDGRYCHKESYPVNFNKKSSLMYTFPTPVRIKEGEVVVAFKTTQADGLIFSISGDKPNCHLSLVIMSGVLKVAYNFNTSSSSSKFLGVETASMKYKFDDGKVYSLKITHNDKKITVQMLDGRSAETVKNMDSNYELLTGVKISIASVKLPLSPQIGLPNNFVGCMSAFKYKYLPNMAKTAVLLDIFGLFGTGSKDVNGNGQLGPCSKSLPTPPPLPRLIGRPTTTTKHVRPAPRMVEITRDYSPIIIGAACAVAVLMLVIIVVLCKHINRSIGAYRTHEDKRPINGHAETSFSPQADSEDGMSATEADRQSKNKYQKKPEVFV